MTASYSTREQTQEEQEVRRALAVYKMALVNANYRNWMHRTKVWLGDKSAIEAEEALLVAEQATKDVVNQTSAHQAVVRVVSSQQPEYVRNRDSFLALIR